MKIAMDLHTHTLACGHGYSTLKENIDAAREAGLKVLGLSEHGIDAPQAPKLPFFNNYKCIPRQYGELRLLCGVEANIKDLNGGLDMPDEVLARMDYVIASMHKSCVTSGSRKENTRACIQAIKNPYVKILGHPDDSRFPLDYEMLVQAAGEEGVFLEVNNASLHPKSFREGSRENILEYLRLCKKYSVSIALGSDSHICYSVGHFEDSLKVLAEAEFPEELVLNAHPEQLDRLLEAKG